MADRNAFWSLWQPLYVNHSMDSGFWSKTLPSSADSFSPFEKQRFAYYWALVETECLTMVHQVAMRPELSIMN